MRINKYIYTTHKYVIKTIYANPSVKDELFIFIGQHIKNEVQ